MKLIYSALRCLLLKKSPKLAQDIEMKTFEKTKVKEDGEDQSQHKAEDDGLYPILEASAPTPPDLQDLLIRTRAELAATKEENHTLKEKNHTLTSALARQNDPYQNRAFDSL